MITRLGKVHIATNEFYSNGQMPNKYINIQTYIICIIIYIETNTKYKYKNE